MQTMARTPPAMRVVSGERQAEDGCGEDEHKDQTGGTGSDARKDETSKVFGDRNGAGEEVEEIARPDVLKEDHGDSLHDTNEEVPKEHGAEKCRDEVVAGGSDPIEELAHESPDDHVDGYP